MPKLLKGVLWVAGILGVLVLIGRLLFFKTWTIPEDRKVAASVAPTLNAGDVVLVLFRGDREDGDLVRCANPENAQQWIIGRITARQSDRVKVEGGFVTVNGRRYRTTESCLKDTVTVTNHAGQQHQLPCSRVEFAGGWHFIATPLEPENDEEHTVGPGRYFLISDNRNDHYDSRDFGAVLTNTCTEKLVFRLWGKNGFFDSDGRFEYLR